MEENGSKWMHLEGNGGEIASCAIPCRRIIDHLIKLNPFTSRIELRNNPPDSVVDQVNHRGMSRHAQIHFVLILQLRPLRHLSIFGRKLRALGK